MSIQRCPTDLVQKVADGTISPNTAGVERMARDLIDARALLAAKDEEIVNHARALDSVINYIPKKYLVRVCEGGGPEDKWSTLSVSVLKMIQALKESPHA